MSLHPRLMAGTVFCATLAAVSLHAQSRFTVLSREEISVAPNLQVMAIRDVAQNTCYLLFVIEAPVPVPRRVAVQPADVAAAAQDRDQRLAALSREYEQGFGSQFVGTPANVLPYQFEAQKIQNEFEHVVREQELTRLAEQLERINTTKVAVSGPAPCGESSTGTTGR